MLPLCSRISLKNLLRLTDKSADNSTKRYPYVRITPLLSPIKARSCQDHRHVSLLQDPRRSCDRVTTLVLCGRKKTTFECCERRIQCGSVVLRNNYTAIWPCQAQDNADRRRRAIYLSAVAGSGSAPDRFIQPFRSESISVLWPARERHEHGGGGRGQRSLRNAPTVHSQFFHTDIIIGIEPFFAYNAMLSVLDQNNQDLK